MTVEREDSKVLPAYRRPKLQRRASLAQISAQEGPSIKPISSKIFRDSIE